MDTETQYKYLYAKLRSLKEPANASEAAKYTAVLSEALEYCEKMLMYLARSPSRSEDMLTYSIEFKELIKLEDKVSKLVCRSNC